MDKSNEKKEEKGHKSYKTTYMVDIVLWTLWGLLMWGFLFTLSVIDSPSNSPGIHEIIITSYFLGFVFIFAIIYIIVVKRG